MHVRIQAKTVAMAATAIAIGSAVMLVAGSMPVAAQTEAVVRNLRLAADAQGSEMQRADDEAPGEKRYSLEAGVSQLFIAFECTGSGGEAVQLRVMQPPGTALDVQDRTCDAVGEQIVEFTPRNPLADNEYVVNVYVGDTEPFLADSIQFTVGAAEIPGGPSEATAPVQSPDQPAVVATVAPIQSPDDVPGGPSTLLLALAGAGVLGLLAVVAWAGWSAMKAS